MSNVRVVSYNVLSPYLTDPNRFIHCSEDDWDGEKRFKNVETIIKNEIAKNSIICLQEVCLDWAGKFLFLFSKSGYKMVNVHYSSIWTGYMGNLIAYPTARYELLDSRLVNPFITQIPKPKLSWMQKLPSKCLTMASKYVVPALVCAPALLALAPSAMKIPTSKLLPLYFAGTAIVATQTIHQTFFPTPHWFDDPKLYPGLEKRARDTLPLLKLKHRNGKSAGFWVSTVHMPCKYWNPSLMTAYAWHLGTAVQNIAQDDPVVFVGDFNVNPSEPAYELLNTGTCTKLPNLTFEGDPSWKAELSYPFRSAYKVANGVEPELTNFAWLQYDGVEQDKYIDTLDYIWLSGEEHWTVDSVGKTLTKDEVLSSYESWPCGKEYPSDHHPISADLTLKKKM